MNQIFGGIECKLYICHVIFFIVLDLRLTKVGVQRYSFFYVRTSALGEKNHLVYVIVSCL